MFFVIPLTTAEDVEKIIDALRCIINHEVVRHVRSHSSLVLMAIGDNSLFPHGILSFLIC